MYPGPLSVDKIPLVWRPVEVSSTKGVMNRNRIHFQIAGILAASLLLLYGTAVYAGGNPDRPVKKTAGVKVKQEKEIGGKLAPTGPTGLPKTPPGLVDDTDVASTITYHRNAQGQTVISVREIKHDVSPPLGVMVASKPIEPFQQGLGEEKIREALERVVPKQFRHISSVPDPVVQTELPSNRFSILPSAPTTGFNFAGQANSCGLGCQPPDTNGTVGYDPATGTSYYLQIVNTKYQVWSLNYGTNTPTSVKATTAINSLWSGFGGNCQTRNDGDPVALYDKLSNRWFLSQFTTAAPYLQCVAVSTSGDPLGTYNRYAFAVPNDPSSGHALLGDYPKWGAWPDGYYMGEHLFDESTTPASYIAGDFAVADRTRMLSGASATVQHILDSNEFGYIPADVDGFAPPPSAAPGIFLSLGESGMKVYRLHVDWATPANTVRTLQTTATYAPFSDVCPGAANYGACIPQPNTMNVLDSLTGHVMFRGAYRNFIDHESMFVTHSVDPSIAGVEAGVRWYEVRISGTPDATCNSFPCIYQQGTLANLGGDGRDRWMGSMATDTAGNALLGYSAQGLTNGSDNHSIRYTGRAATDTLGTMTGPEVVVFSGTKNNSGGRWGDYSDMTIDPIDDCTFWYTTEYYASNTTWSTRINSARFPAGIAAGQCPATTCTARPSSVPTIGAATVPGNNQITVNWTGISPAPGSYAVERSEGTCASPTSYYQPLAFVSGGNTNYTDTSVQGGHTYNYRVVAATDANGKCQGTAFSGCVEATATGNCVLKPTFTGDGTNVSSNNATCGVSVTWNAATSNCPLGSAVRYNIFRGTVPDFVPAPANRIARCVSGTSYLDASGLSSGTTYYYVLRAEDTTTLNGGECNGGNEESNSIVSPGTPYGAGLQAGTGTWNDGGGDSTSFMKFNGASLVSPAEPFNNNTDDPTWRYLSTSTDAGVNHTSGGSYAYRDAGPLSTSSYVSDVCSELATPNLTVGATSVALSYWMRHNEEYQWDGVAVEYSKNNGAWTAAPTPSPATDWGPLAQTGTPPVNACGYTAAGQSMYTGPNPNTAASTAYAQRSHTITGLANNDLIKFRWRLSSDPAATFTGFYLDDITVSNIHLPNVCSVCTSGSAPTMSTLTLTKSGSNINFVWPAAAGATGYYTYSATSLTPTNWNVQNTTTSGTGWTDPYDLSSANNLVFFSTTAFNCAGESPK